MTDRERASERVSERDKEARQAAPFYLFPAICPRCLSLSASLLSFVDWNLVIIVSLPLFLFSFLFCGRSCEVPFVARLLFLVVSSFLCFVQYYCGYIVNLTMILLFGLCQISALLTLIFLFNFLYLNCILLLLIQFQYCDFYCFSTFCINCIVFYVFSPVTSICFLFYRFSVRPVFF